MNDDDETYRGIVLRIDEPWVSLLLFAVGFVFGWMIAG